MTTTVKTLLCCLIFLATLQAITGHKGHHKRGQRHRVEGYQYSRPSQQHSSYGGSSYYGGYASSPVGAPFKQQQEAGSFRCSRAGFFSHETDCTRFYRCVDYYGNGRYLTLYRFVCAEGTIFDPSLSVCNHPSWISPPPKCAGNTSPIVPPPHQPPVGPVHPSPTQPPPVVPTGPVYPSPPQPTITPLQPPTKPPVYPSPPPATQAPFVPGPATATEPQQPPVTLTPPVGAGGSGAGGLGAGGAPGGLTTEGPCVTEISISGELPNAPEGGSGTFPTIGGGGVIFPTEAPTVAPPSIVTDSSTVSIGGGGVVSPATDSPSTESSTATIVTEPSSTGSSGVTDVSITTTDSSLLVGTTPSSPSGGQQESSSPSPVSPIVSPPTASPSVPTVTSPPVTASTVGPSTGGGGGVISGGLPFMLVCGDQDLHQHPLRCDLFYQCIWNGLSFTINVYSCRAGQEFHEPSKTCRNPDPAVPCKAPSSANATIVLPSSETTTTTSTSTTTPASTPQYTLSPGSLYNCVRPGHFPYQLDCVRFYRCFEVIPGVLKGLLYRCPAGYGYSITTERCEKEATLPPCDRSFIKIGDFPIPMIPIEDTTVVSVEDFDDFFGNPNYLYRPRF